MDEEKIIALLRCPSAPLVELALAMANLTWKEELAITFAGGGHDAGAGRRKSRLQR